MGFPGFENVRQAIISNYLANGTVYNNSEPPPEWGQETVDLMRIRIVKANLEGLPAGAKYWKLIGFHWLTGSQNGGRNNLYFETVDGANGHVRISPPTQARTIWYRWGWNGQQSHEPSPNVPQEKPLNELDNIGITSGNQHIWCHPIEVTQSGITAIRYDQIENVRTDRPAHGEPGRHYAHHSYYAMWSLEPATSGGSTPPPVTPPPGTTPPVDGDFEIVPTVIPIDDGTGRQLFVFGGEVKKKIVEPEPTPPTPEPTPPPTWPRLGRGMCYSNTTAPVSARSPARGALKYMTQIKWLKMMSNSPDDDFNWALSEKYNFVTRLFHPTKDVSAQEFVSYVMPRVDWLMARNQPLLQVWNEPNHMHKVEGNWTPESFAQFSIEVAQRILARQPGAKLIYAPMALPDFAHHGNSYYQAAIDSGAMSLYWGVGAHCYWQNKPGGDPNMHLDEQFGAYFKPVARMFPDKPIIILEAGSSYEYQNPSDWRAWYAEVDKYPQVIGDAPFIIDSPDEAWRKPFCWIDKDGQMHEVCEVLK